MRGARPKPNGMQMLNAVLERVDDLLDTERAAFFDMRERFLSSSRSKLSPAQEAWIGRVYRRLELDANEPCENLISNGIVAPGERGPVRRKLYDFERMPRPLKPPGRC